MDELHDEAWNRATCDVNSHKARMAKEVIKWIFLARREFIVEALADILSASGYGNGVDRITEQEMVSSCAGFVWTETAKTRA